MPAGLPAWGRRWPVRSASLLLAGTLLGCASPPDVRPLATGRADVSAYELNGSDADGLRRTAQRLCPLGGEVLRQAMQPAREAPAGSRWHRMLDGATHWTEPTPPASQLVVVCRGPDERLRLAPASVAALPARAASEPAALPSAASSARPAWRAGQDGEVSTAPPVPAVAALPIGPITPQW